MVDTLMIGQVKEDVCEVWPSAADGNREAAAKASINVEDGAGPIAFVRCEIEEVHQNE